MPNAKQPSDNACKTQLLSDAAALKICKKHSHRQAAQKIVDALPYRASLKPDQIEDLVTDQISKFAHSLVKCVRSAHEIDGKVEKLPRRAEQGVALREIRGALDNLRNSVERNWELLKPHLEIESVEKLSSLLTTEAIEALLPVDLRSKYIKTPSTTVEYNRQRLLRSLLLEAGSWPLTQLIKRAKVSVRHAEQSIPSGASLKAPFQMALLMQLADHFEWALEKKASWTDNGPFSKFSADVFAELEFESDYSWEYLLREGLKLHRSSFVTRRCHTQPSETTGNDHPARRHMMRKKLLVPKSRKMKKYQ